LGNKNGLDELVDKSQFQLFLDKTCYGRAPNRRPFYRRARRKIRTRWDRCDLETDYLELFRLMILEIWWDEFLGGESQFAWNA
jgi:hypothetical protein